MHVWVRLSPTDFMHSSKFDFHENRLTLSQVGRVALSKSVLGSFDSNASNAAPSVEMGPLGAILDTSKRVELLQLIVNSIYLKIRTFQKQPDRSQVVGFQRLPIIRRARSSAFQRTSNQLYRTQLKA